MGSSGMKRKGRRHLPKVGTRPATEQELHDRHVEALHPFSADPLPQGRSVWGITGIAVAVLAVIGVVALMFAT